MVPAGDVYGGGSPTGIAFYENGIMEDRFGGYVIVVNPHEMYFLDINRNSMEQESPYPKETFSLPVTRKTFAGADFASAGRIKV